MITIKQIAWNSAKGLLAGYAALKVMEPVTDVFYEWENPSAKKGEENARGGKAAYEVAAEKVSKLFNMKLSAQELNSLSVRLHLALGLSASVLYAWLRPKKSKVNIGQGLRFGAAFFFLVDEGLNTVLGFTPPPQKFPWQAHARGAAAHLAYGLVSEGVLSVLTTPEDQATPQKLAA